MPKELRLPLLLSSGAVLIVAMLLSIQPLLGQLGAIPESAYQPHAQCLLFNPSLINTYTISDLLTGMSYLTISIFLVLFVSRAQRQLPFNWVFLSFGAFIFFCGLTHFFDVFTMWTPAYWSSAATRALTAFASVTTALTLPPLLPRAMKMINAARTSEAHRQKLIETNQQLAEEISMRRRVEEELRAALEQATLYKAEKEVAAQQERQRLARELHDAVSQTLFASQSIAEGLARSSNYDTPQAKTLLEQLMTLNRGAMAEMRMLLLELRPEAVYKTKLEALLSQLAQAAQARKQLEVQLNIEVDGVAILSPEVHNTFYRIAQEALNNVLKHSQATCVTIELNHRRESTHLRIHDNGQGFDPNQEMSGLGLMSMRERVREIGASISITSSPVNGTEIIVRYPASAV